MSNVNWKSEATYVAIGGALIALLAGFGLLVGDEATQAGQVVANMTAGVLGLIGLVRGIRARTKADK